jgi:hypothetical protein
MAQRGRTERENIYRTFKNLVEMVENLTGKTRVYPFFFQPIFKKFARVITRFKPVYEVTQTE